MLCVAAMVPAGSIWSTGLIDCPKNTYKNSVGNCQDIDSCCTPCPDGKVTALHGSFTESDCYSKPKNMQSNKIENVLTKKVKHMSFIKLNEKK